MKIINVKKDRTGVTIKEAKLELKAKVTEFPV